METDNNLTQNIEDNELEHTPTNDRIHKGIVLMKSAIKKYEEGNFNMADNDRKEANRNFDIAMKEMSTEEGMDDMMYGECRNFGLLYNVLESNTHNLYPDKADVLQEFVDLIRGNKVLSEEFNAYNAFVSPVNVEDNAKYVNEAIALVPHYSKKVLRENNNKFLKLIRKYNLNENVGVDDDMVSVFESVEYAMLNGKDLSNINEFAKVEKILENCVRENNRIVEEVSDHEAIYEEKVDELAKKYDKIMNEDEKSLLKKMSLSEAKKTSLFEETKQLALEALRTEIDKSEDGEKKEWNEIFEQISKTAYNPDTFLVDLSKMIEIKDSLSE